MVPLNRPTFIVGVIAIAISVVPVTIQLLSFLTCGNGSGPPLCGAYLPEFQFDFLAVAGLVLLGLSFRFRQSMAFVRAHSAPVGLGLLLAGILAAAEGPALIGESGVLFGPTGCAGSWVGCMKGQDVVSFELWSGIALTTICLGAVPTGLFLFIRSKRAMGPAGGIFGSPSQKKLALVCLVLVSFVSLFFLAPFVPVQVRSPSQQISGANIVCYQIESAVYNPVFIYGGYASPGEHLLGVGNAVYDSCIVTNPS